MKTVSVSDKMSLNADDYSDCQTPEQVIKKSRKTVD